MGSRGAQGVTSRAVRSLEDAGSTTRREVGCVLERVIKKRVEKGLFVGRKEMEAGGVWGGTFHSAIEDGSQLQEAAA